MLINPCPFMLQTWLTLLIIVTTIIGVAIGRYPGLRMNRATIALVGATLLIATNAISLEQAYASLDLDTLILLFAMMILNVNLRLAGFFRLVASKTVYWAQSPRQLLALIIITAGCLSAFFLNDTIVIVFTPLVLEIVLALKRNPLPYLMGLATAANIGSCATITGNPQNMLIGIASHIPFITFSGYLTPIALIGLGLSWLVIVLVYSQEFATTAFNERPHFHNRPYRPLLLKSSIAAGGMIIGFVMGWPIPLAALTAASLLLITRRLKPERVLLEIDWSLLVFFASLFVVTGAIDHGGFSQSMFTVMQPIAQGGVLPLTIIATLLSNLISNVPAVLLFRPLVPTFPNPTQTWLTLAMSTTLAGNLTLLGSVANLIVAETAKRSGVQLSFTEYLKTGLIITLSTLTVGVLWLNLVL